MCQNARDGEAINIRKFADYGTILHKMVTISVQNFPWMSKVHIIGKASGQRLAKGVAVTAAELL